jgi:three-Cys-motif partner protein
LAGTIYGCKTMKRRVGTNAQNFGGPWSLIKTEIIAEYLRAYTVALKNQSFRLVYIDAFAGSGEFTFDSEPGLLLDPQAAAKAHAGSAKNALAVNPPFDELVFIEEKARNVASLKSLIVARPEAQVIPGDANTALAQICNARDWQPRRRRGVVFLDPFGLSVEWRTLCAIAKTQALDLWYLFSLAGLYRNAPLSIDALDSDKHAAIVRALGDERWVDNFYAQPKSLQQKLFDELPQPAVRTLTVDGMEAYVLRRLRTIFPYVAAPKRLFGGNNAPLFSLFFAVSNPNKLARALAARIAGHILARV